MVLAVTPQYMASLDVVPSQQAFVRATVIDNFGNPVPNEIVTFSLGSPTGTLTAPPYLDSASSTTDKDGNAIVIFHPGAFPAWGQPGYNGTATGSVPVIATWKRLLSTGNCDLEKLSVSQYRNKRESTEFKIE